MVHICHQVPMRSSAFNRVSVDMAESVEANGSSHWRSEWKCNRLRLSPWMLDCLTLEFEDNLHGMHDECHCLCGRCYQLTWLRKPQHCKCRGWQKKRYLGLDDRIRTRRRMCRCNPAKKVKWMAWFCNRCTEVCEMIVSAPCVRRRQADDAVLDDLEERVAAGYTTSGSSVEKSDSTSYRGTSPDYSSGEDTSEEEISSGM